MVSAYLDITLPGVVPEPLGRLVDHCRREGKQLLIGMDSNSHSTLWGCEDDSARGEVLEGFILTNSLVVGNRGSVPDVF